jgi:hypothetical protein
MRKLEFQSYCGHAMKNENNIEIRYGNFTVNKKGQKSLSKFVSITWVEEEAGLNGHFAVRIVAWSSFWLACSVMLCKWPSINNFTPKKYRKYRLVVQIKSSIIFSEYFFTSSIWGTNRSCFLSQVWFWTNR